MHIVEWFRGLHPLHKVAWVLLTIWAAFWLWFNIASGIAEIAELGLMALVSHLVLPVVIVLVLWLCWRWPLGGGIALLALAGAMFGFFGWYDWAVALALESPVIVIGVLLIGGSLLTHRHSPVAR